MGDIKMSAKERNKLEILSRVKDRLDYTGKGLGALGSVIGIPGGYTSAIENKVIKD